ncbi:hypothetical protein LCGC14_2882140 [marine sediment metagenome]|uniref:Uncharacterized protein n=1 Tax=marine sediment metagenome TaxID=412755 RepID=A0A0F8XZS8_9ZZZZ
MNADKINGIGVSFRFITPVLITITIFLLSWIRTDVTKLSTHFTNHLSHHRQLEVDYQGRLTRLEGKVNDAKIGTIR